MSRAKNLRSSIIKTSLVALVVELLIFGLLVHFDPLHSGILNVFSLAFLTVIAALAVIKWNFSFSQIKGFILREKLACIALIFCLAFCAVSAASITQSWKLSNTSGEAITYDEVALLPVGYYYLSNGQYFLSPEHPPLVKVISAIPFYFLHVNQPKPVLPKSVLIQPYAQFYWGKTFLFESGNKTETMIFAARMADLLVNTALIFGLFLSVAYLWSRRSGLITVVLITTSQFLISQAGLAILDFMSGILSILALVWFAGWLQAFVHKRPTRLKLIASGVFLALALLAKFSTVLLLPGAVLIGGLYLLLNWQELKRRRLSFVLGIVKVCVLALVLVVLFYAPLVRNMSSGDLANQLNLSYDTTRLPNLGLRILRETAKVGVLGRAAAEYANGVLLDNNRIYQGAGGVYFRGHFYGAEGAGPSYFPLLYLAKLQIVYHLLTLVALTGAIWFIAKEKWAGVSKRLKANPLVMALLIYCLVFSLIATLSTLQIGLRHLMPVIPGMMLLTAIGVDYVIKKSQLNRVALLVITAIVTLCLVGSVAKTYPYYLSYYNAAAAGTSNGYKFAVDSNYDWEQDLKRLGKWEQDNNVHNLHFDMFIDPYLPTQYYLGADIQPYNIAKDPPLAPGSYLAVSVNQYEINTHQPKLPASQKYNQYDKDLVARVGTTIFIYKIPAR